VTDEDQSKEQQGKSDEQAVPVGWITGAAMAVTAETAGDEKAIKQWLDYGIANVVPIITNGNWIMGDWLLMANETFPEKTDGRKKCYALAEEHLHIHRTILYNIAMVARSYLPNSRNERVSWTHHRFAMALGTGKPEQEQLKERMDALAHAADKDLTVTQFKQYVANLTGKKSGSKIRPLGAGLLAAKLEVLALARGKDVDILRDEICQQYIDSESVKLEIELARSEKKAAGIMKAAETRESNNQWIVTQINAVIEESYQANAELPDEPVHFIQLVEQRIGPGKFTKHVLQLGMKYTTMKDQYRDATTEFESLIDVSAIN
jgi:hypothetical protein